MEGARPYNEGEGADAAQALPSGSVTFVFTDIEGSTVLLKVLGRTQYAEALSRHREIIADATESRGGHVVNTPGDAMFLAFSEPVSAILAMREAFIGLAAEPWPLGVAFRVRAGAHAGAAAPRGRDYVSMVVHQAARVGAAAHGGQMLMSSSVALAAAGSLPPGIGLRDLGRFVIRDFPLPEPLFQLQAAELPNDFPRPRTATAIRGNLPITRDSFVGRVPELAQIISDVRGAESRDKAIITLVGPGGVGKSRLSAEVASSVGDYFADGAWRIELASVADGSEVVAAVAQVLGTTSPARGNSLDALVNQVAGRRMLVLLDNCEHVVDQAAAVADALSATPGVIVLATSRSPFGLPAEVVHRVNSLGVGDGTQLFLDRASTAGATCLDQRVVEDLVRELDGIPLALELAAASTSSLGLNEVAARLDDRFRLLRSGSRRSLPQHRTLRALVDWSYNLLDDTERVLFRRLAVLSGGFSIGTALDVCSWDPLFGGEIENALGRLVDKSLVHVAPGLGGETRYTMLETLRMYATERLVEAGEEAETHRRHLRAMAAFARVAGVGIMGPEFRTFLRRCDEEVGNLNSALKWPLTDEQSRSDRLELVIATGGYWSVSESAMAALPLWHSIIEDPQNCDPSSVLRAKLVMAAFLANSADPAKHLGMLEEILAETAAGAPSVRHVHALSLLAWAHSRVSEQARAETEIEAAVEEATQLGLTRILPFVVLYSSNVYARSGKLQMSRERAVRATEIAASIGQLPMMAIAETGAGWAYLAQQDFDTSEGPSRRTAGAGLETNSAAPTASARLNLGHVERLKGRRASGAVHYAEGYALAAVTGDKSQLAEALEGLTILCAETGAIEDGARLMGVAAAFRADSQPYEPVIRPAFEAAVTNIESSLSGSEMQSLRAQGLGLPVEEIQSFVQRVAETLKGVSVS